MEKPDPIQRRHTGNGFSALAETIARMTEPLVGQRGFAAATLAVRWHEIVGIELARHSWPERLSHAQGRHRSSSLQLGVSTGAIALELQHQAPVIMERINAMFGHRLVERLIIRHGRPPSDRAAGAAPRSSSAPVVPPLIIPEIQPALARQLESVADPILRSHLRALAQAITTSRIGVAEDENRAASSIRMD